MILEPAKGKRLFFLCWFAYFAANLGRLSYTVAMVEIMAAEGLTGAQAGLVGTGFFAAYGVCQLFSGYLGDKVPPRWMVAVGLGGTGLLNACMALGHGHVWMLAVWCLNGVFQSMLWPPILRTVVEYYPPQRRKPVLVALGTTYPVATLLAYLLGGLLVWLAGWQGVFWLFAAIVLAAAALWTVGLEGYPPPKRAGQGAVGASAEQNRNRLQNGAHGGRKAGLARQGQGVVAVLALFCGALIIQGFLRDGLMNWVPSFLEKNFPVSSAMAIISTTVLPLVNLAAIYLTNLLYKRAKDEAKTSVLLFAVAAGAAVLLWCFGQGSLPAALGLFAIITGCMMGVNLMLISFVPACFSHMGKTAFVSGFMNAMVYVGSSLSTYGIGKITDRFGWGAILAVLAGVAALGTAFCGGSVPLWRRFCRSQQNG